MDDEKLFVDNLIEWTHDNLTYTQKKIEELILEKKGVHPQFDTDILSDINKKLNYLNGRKDTFSQLLQNISDLYANSRGDYCDNHP